MRSTGKAIPTGEILAQGAEPRDVREDQLFHQRRRVGIGKGQSVAYLTAAGGARYAQQKDVGGAGED